MDLDRRRLVPPWPDVVLAGAFLAVSLAQVVVEPIAGPVVSVLVAIGSAVPLAWRRTAPTAAAFAGTAIWAVPTPHGFLFSGFVIAVLLFFSVGAHVPQTWRVLLVTAFGATVGVVMTLLGPEDPAAAPGAALAVVAPAVAGRLVARYRLQNARLRELTEELVRERARAEHAAVTEERTRIARELHDVIGHEVTVIALQADAAAAALEKAPDRAGAPILAIRGAAAQALDEMRRVVQLLRRPGEEGEELHPQPGLTDLCALVDAARAAGTPVDVALRLPDVPPLPSVQLAAYRLVQEALTNSRRHAPGSAVHVRVDCRQDELCVEVVTEGGRPGRNPGSGHGIVGMRERVRMHGGRLDVGPIPDGYAVRARLPLSLPTAP